MSGYRNQPSQGDWEPDEEPTAPYVRKDNWAVNAEVAVQVNDIGATRRMSACDVERLPDAFDIEVMNADIPNDNGVGIEGRAGSSAVFDYQQGRSDGYRAGRNDGMRAGEALGIRQGLYEALLLQLRAHHWPIDGNLMARIQSCSDPIQLRCWVERATTARHLHDVFGDIFGDIFGDGSERNAQL